MEGMYPVTMGRSTRQASERARADTGLIVGERTVPAKIAWNFFARPDDITNQHHQQHACEQRSCLNTQTPPMRRTLSRTARRKYHCHHHQPPANAFPLERKTVRAAKLVTTRRNHDDAPQPLTHSHEAYCQYLPPAITPSPQPSSSSPPSPPPSSPPRHVDLMVARGQCAVARAVDWREAHTRRENAPYASYLRYGQRHDALARRRDEERVGTYAICDTLARTCVSDRYSATRCGHDARDVTNLRRRTTRSLEGLVGA